MEAYLQQQASRALQSSGSEAGSIKPTMIRTSKPSQDTQSNKMFDHKMSQWEILMRKFSHDCQRLNNKCRSALTEDLTCEFRAKKTFATGSTYEGTWDCLGLCGYGLYTFPNGVEYEGEFQDNAFHGNGELWYPDGTIIKGKWDRGEITERKIIFPDGVHFRDENWNYCKAPDRRYSREYYEGIQPAGASYITNEQPPIEVPKGMYDVGEGFFDPESETIYDYNDPSAVLRFPGPQVSKWILENCRKNPDESVGPCPELYGQWNEAAVNPKEPSTPSCISWCDDDESDYESILNEKPAGRISQETTASMKTTPCHYNPARLSQSDFRPECHSKDWGTNCSLLGSMVFHPVLRTKKLNNDKTEKCDESSLNKGQ